MSNNTSDRIIIISSSSSCGGGSSSSSSNNEGEHFGDVDMSITDMLEHDKDDKLPMWKATMINITIMCIQYEYLT